MKWRDSNSSYDLRHYLETERGRGWNGKYFERRRKNFYKKTRGYVAKSNRMHYLCVIKPKQESFGLLNLIHTSDDREVTKIQ